VAKKLFAFSICVFGLNKEYLGSTCKGIDIVPVVGEGSDGFREHLHTQMYCFLLSRAIFKGQKVCVVDQKIELLLEFSKGNDIFLFMAIEIEPAEKD